MGLRQWWSAGLAVGATIPAMKRRVGVLLILTVLLTGCGSEQAVDTAAQEVEAATPRAEVVEPVRQPLPTAEPVLASDGLPVDATLTIESIGVTDLVVEAYEGYTDDAPGTVIQDTGIAASPYGAAGGVGPGGIGNYQVTAHRSSSTRAFLDLPDVRNGDEVVVVADGTRYIYEITETRETSFRSPGSLAAQRAAVPGRPGETADRAYVTLSTCATFEDHAAGNYWSDEFGNPEHRIDKIGELVAIESA